MSGGRVGIYCRYFTAVLAGWGLWQLLWLNEEADWVNASVPHPFSVTFWILVWAFVAATSVIATATGKDGHARVSLASVCVAASMAATAEITARLDDWWWQTGQSTVIFLLVLILLISPLRWGLDPTEHGHDT